MEIQEMINAGVKIPAGEYEGPFLINRSAAVDGGGAYLYIRDSEAAALNVSSSGVILKNVNLEAATVSSPALLIVPDTKLENVCVYGAVVGKVGEEGFFDVPYMLDVGNIPAGEPFEFTVNINVPTECEIVAERGVSVSLERLIPGLNTLGIRLPAARAGSIIKVSVYIKTAVYRKMIFTAKAMQNAEKKSYAQLLFEPEGNSVFDLPQIIKSSEIKKTASVAENQIQKVIATDNRKKALNSGITSILPKVPVTGHTIITRGMHYPIRQDDYLEIEFVSDSYSDIDAYVFLHDGSMVMRDSRNLIFFGNDTAANNSISYLHTSLKRAVYVDMKLITNKIGEIDVVYASYDNAPIKGTVHIKTSAGTLEVRVDAASSVITAFQIAANPPGFVLTPLVMPYRRGIAELIRSYGLEVN
jgi:stress response protein SCP2